MFDAVIGFSQAVLTFLHDIVEPVFGIHAWGWAIILLTLLVRVLLLPLAIKQTRSMRAMQALQPQIKELQKKYKVDRDLLRKDPETYKARKQKLNEEMMGLMQREGANPAASCLPLLAQAPVFLALFWTLQRSQELRGEEFYFFTAVGEGGLEQLVSQAGWPGWLLILLMSGTMFWSQRQMLARSALTQVGDNPMAQQQKILMYVMPVFLAVISFNFPMGILLYWVTTNAWQVAQQAIILREVKSEAASGELADKPGGEAAKPSANPDRPRRSPGASSGTKPVSRRTDDDEPSATKRDADAGSSETSEAAAAGDTGENVTGKGGSHAATPTPPTADPGPTTGANGSSSNGSTRRRDHLPRRGGGTRS